MTVNKPGGQLCVVVVGNSGVDEKGKARDRVAYLLEASNLLMGKIELRGYDRNSVEIFKKILGKYVSKEIIEAFLDKYLGYDIDVTSILIDKGVPVLTLKYWNSKDGEKFDVRVDSSLLEK